MEKKKQKSFRTLATDLKEIRKRQPSRQQIEKANAVFEEKPKENQAPQRKIARDLEIN